MDFQHLRHRMVEEQLIPRGIRDPGVLRAMRTVPRERFLGPHMTAFAYDDRPLSIDCGQTISQPFIVALMAQALGLGPDDWVLEVGSGSGYAAAVLGQIAAEVFGIEWHAPLARAAAHRIANLRYENVHIRCGDGSLGWPEEAPFDGISVAAGGTSVPPTLLEQLATHGRLVIPVGHDSRDQELLRITRYPGNDFAQESLGRVCFVPLLGGSDGVGPGR